MPLKYYDYCNFRNEIDNFVESIRPSEKRRNTLDFTYNIDKHQIEIGTLRRAFPGTPGMKVLCKLVRFQYIHHTKAWRVSWYGLDMKWIPHKEVSSLQEALHVFRLHLFHRVLNRKWCFRSGM